GTRPHTAGISTRYRAPINPANRKANIVCRWRVDSEVGGGKGTKLLRRSPGALVPTLHVGTHAGTRRVPSSACMSGQSLSGASRRDAERPGLAFPRGAWERGSLDIYDVPSSTPGEILMQDDVVALFAYDRWANAKVFDACRKLTAEQYVAEPVPGWSSVRSTISHIALATEFNLRALAGDPDDHVPTEADLATVDDV